MLAEYERLLDQLRQNRQEWTQLAFVDSRDETGRLVDPRYRVRYGVLICLQYDRRETDRELLRYVLEQEAASREADPFQGDSAALGLAGYLLACHKRVEDVWLLSRVRSANFDTFCGFDVRHLFAAGIEETLETLRKDSGPEREELLESLSDETTGMNIPTSEQMLEFWEEKAQAYPTRLEDEDALGLVYRSIELDAIAEACYRLESWEAQQPQDRATLRTLMHCWNDLGKPERSLVCARMILSMDEPDLWSVASARLDVLRYAIAAGEFQQAWDMLEQVLVAFRADPELKILGLARATIELALDLSTALPKNHALRRPAMMLADSLMRQGFAASYNIYTKALALAREMGEEALTKRYSRLADKEQKRIQAMLKGEV